jgi:hypothetical protein
MEACFDEEVWENQRFIPFKGFSVSNLLPGERAAYSTVDGQTPLSDDNTRFPTCDLPPGWAWSTKWQTDTTYTEVDDEGFVYGVDFSRLDGPKRRPIHFVRRRRWLRTRTIGRETMLEMQRKAFVEEEISSQASAALNQVLQSAFQCTIEFALEQDAAMQHALQPFEAQWKLLSSQIYTGTQQLQDWKEILELKVAVELEHASGLRRLQALASSKPWFRAGPLAMVHGPDGAAGEGQAAGTGAGAGASEEDEERETPASGSAARSGTGSGSVSKILTAFLGAWMPQSTHIVAQSEALQASLGTELGPLAAAYAKETQRILAEGGDAEQTLQAAMRRFRVAAEEFRIISLHHIAAPGGGESQDQGGLQGQVPEPGQGQDRTQEAQDMNALQQGEGDDCLQDKDRQDSDRQGQGRASLDATGWFSTFGSKAAGGAIAVAGGAAAVASAASRASVSVASSATAAVDRSVAEGKRQAEMQVDLWAAECAVASTFSKARAAQLMFLAQVGSLTAEYRAIETRRVTMLKSMLQGVALDQRHFAQLQDTLQCDMYGVVSQTDVAQDVHRCAGGEEGLRKASAAAAAAEGSMAMALPASRLVARQGALQMLHTDERGQCWRPVHCVLTLSHVLHVFEGPSETEAPVSASHWADAQPSASLDMRAPGSVARTHSLSRSAHLLVGSAPAVSAGDGGGGGGEAGQACGGGVSFDRAIVVEAVRASRGQASFLDRVKGRVITSAALKLVLRDSTHDRSQQWIEFLKNPLQAFVAGTADGGVSEAAAAAGGESSQPPADYCGLLVELFQKHNPAKLGEVQALLTKYKGREDQLIAAVRQKYGDADDAAPSPAAAAAAAFGGSPSAAPPPPPAAPGPAAAVATAAAAEATEGSSNQEPGPYSEL